MKPLQAENYTIFVFDGYRDTTNVENEMMQKLVMYGPSAIAVGIYDESIRFYAGGVYSGVLCNQPNSPVNHAVTLYG